MLGSKPTPALRGLRPAVQILYTHKYKTPVKYTGVLYLCAGTRARLELFELLAENSEIVTKWNIKVKEILGKDISVTRLHITL